MRGRRFLVTWCEGDTAEALKAAYQGERDLEFRTRLHGLWLLRCGWRLLWVAAAVGSLVSRGGSRQCPFSQDGWQGASAVPYC